MLIHGGGWQPSQSGYEDELRNAESLQQLGYATVVVGYDAGALGFRQIEAVYRQARQRYPDLPICASGISAGGNYSLMLAAREPQLTCVVDLVGPTDLTTLQEQGGTEAYNLAVAAFGKDNLARFSPVRYADQIKAKVLMILAATDPIVPVAQGSELTQVLPSAELMVLPAGPVPTVWAHGGGLMPDAQQTALDRELAFLSQATEGG